MPTTTVLTYAIKPEHIQDFIAACIANHEASIQEPGNLRFDFLQSSDDPTRFMLYETYQTEEAAKAHKETSHYKKWKEQTANWLAKPREAVKYNMIRPEKK